MGKQCIRRLVSVLVTLTMIFSLCQLSSAVIGEKHLIEDARAEERIILNKTSLTLAKKRTYQLKLNGVESKNVKWTSTNKKVAKVTNGKVKALKPGKATVIAKYNNKSYQCKVTVTNKILLNNKSLTLMAGRSYQLELYNAKNKKVKWKTSNKKIVSVKNGKVKALKVGKATITAIYKKKKYKCRVKVIKAVIKLNSKNVIIKEGKTYKLKLLNAVNQKVKWTSSNKVVATVSRKGVVTGKKQGTATITATYKKKKYKCNVQVLHVEKTPSKTNTNTNNANTNNNNNANTQSETDSDHKKTTESDQNANTEPQEKETIISNGNVKALVSSGNTEEDRKMEKKIDDESVDFFTTTDENGEEIINYVVSNNNPLYQYVVNDFYKVNDLIYMPKNEYFMTGMSYIYLGHDDEYSDEQSYDVDSYEVLHLKQASLPDLYEGQVDYKADQLNESDPVAFTWTPEQQEETSLKRATSRKLATRVNNDNKLKFNTETVDGAFKIGAYLKDYIVYDDDRDADTTFDQIKFNSSVELANVKPVTVMDWNFPNLLPDQLKFGLNYNFNYNVKTELGGSVDTTKVAKAANKALRGWTFNNKRNFHLFSVEGIDFSKKILLGAVGLNLFVPNPVTVGIRSIAGQSYFYKVTPIIVVLFTIDLDGKLEVNVVGQTEYSSYHEKYVNIQKNGYENGNGTVEENKSDQHFEALDHSFDVKDATYKSAIEKDKKPETKITLEAAGSVKVSAGLCPSIGIMIDGIIPVMILTEGGVEGEGKLGGKAKIVSGEPVELTGTARIKGDLFVKVALLFRFKVMDEKGWIRGEHTFEKNYDLAKAIITDFKIPKKARTIPDDAVELNGHYYYLLKSEEVGISSWDEAEEYCEDEGGHLATITSEEENQFLYKYLTNSGYDNAYFGYTDSKDEGSWQWVNGEESVYKNWKSGEPNDESPGEDYAMFYYKFSDGTWNDGDFGGYTLYGETNFICEWDPVGE